MTALEDLPVGIMTGLVGRIFFVALFAATLMAISILRQLAKGVTLG